MSPYNNYDRLPQHGSDVDEKESSHLDQPAASHRRKRSGIRVLVGICLVLSLSANAYFLHQRYFQPQTLYNDIPSKYAHLRRDVLKQIVPPQEYSSLNRTIQDAAWGDPSLNSWGLFLALDEDYVVSQDLPHAMRWPWDSNKGVYIPTAAHELHCVDVVRSFVNGKQDGLPDAELEWDYTHTIHCLNILRETVMCNADDLPMYTGKLHDNVHFRTPIAGRGMTRMCRNWDALVAWAHERSACYLSTHRKDPTFLEIDRYKHCPDGSRPWVGQTDASVPITGPSE